MLQKAYEIMVNDKECLDFLRNKYRYIQVDEYQDTNLIQKDIIYLLAGQDGNLAVVGDDDQSIYAFRGAKPEIMLNFQKEYPKSKMVKMSTNYRSGKKIISEADRVIKSNTNRFQKDFIGFKPENGAVEYIVMHGSKGLEWKHVFIIDCVEGVCPSPKAETAEELEEERRLFYVAMTRAKEHLYLCYYKAEEGKTVVASPYIM